ncbi:MAG: nucleotidyltransferase domain-containing protein [Acidobacteriia bacterium]|nr:nucleotidyltransferase domain-containing protein [Terriglobia bacterium]
MTDTEELLHAIVRRIVETARPEKIVLFGSRARGDARENSDYDFLVIKDSDEPPHRREVPLYLALADVHLPIAVVVYTPEEVNDWREVPQAFVTTALREGRVVYERPR